LHPQQSAGQTTQQAMISTAKDAIDANPRLAGGRGHLLAFPVPVNMRFTFFEDAAQLQVKSRGSQSSWTSHNYAEAIMFRPSQTFAYTILCVRSIVGCQFIKIA